MLDDKSLNPSEGAFARVYNVHDPECLAMYKKINDPINGGVMFISEKRNAAAYIPNSLWDKFYALCPDVESEMVGDMRIVHISLKDSECRQSISAIILRAAYDVEFRAFNMEAIEHAQRLCILWGAKQLLREVNCVLITMDNTILHRRLNPKSE